MGGGAYEGGFRSEHVWQPLLHLPGSVPQFHLCLELFFSFINSILIYWVLPWGFSCSRGELWEPVYSSQGLDCLGLNILWQASPTSYPGINQHSPPGFTCFLGLFLWTPIGIFHLLDSILSLILSTWTPSDLAVMLVHSYLLGSCF